VYPLRQIASGHTNGDAAYFVLEPLLDEPESMLPELGLPSAPLELEPDGEALEPEPLEEPG
jgi:hypothetical protein